MAEKTEFLRDDLRIRGHVYGRKNEPQHAVINMDPFREMIGYTGPVLLVHGTADRIVDIRYSRKLREIYPDCRYEEIRGGGHMFRAKADEQACRILREFMDRE